MANGHRVLVVDGQPETAEVLKAVLEPRGLQVDRIRSRLTADAAQSEPVPPSVIVLHEESPTPPDPGNHWPGVPRIVIGSLECHATAAQTDSRPLQRLSAPFHYGELIQAIDTLLGSARAAG